MQTTKTPCIYLIEEDEKSSAYIRGAIIDTSYKCDVHPFSTGAEAVEALFNTEAPKPDMILLSLTIEDMNGIDVLKKIKADDRLRGVPTIVLGDGQDPALVKEAYSNYANSFIKKVTTIGDYMSVVKNLKNLWLMRISV